MRTEPEVLTLAHHVLVIYYHWSLLHHLLMYTTAIYTTTGHKAGKGTYSLCHTLLEHKQSRSNWVCAKTSQYWKCLRLEKQQQKTKTKPITVATLGLLTYVSYTDSVTAFSSVLSPLFLFPVRPWLRSGRSSDLFNAVSEEVLAGPQTPGGGGIRRCFIVTSLTLGQTGSHGCFWVHRPIKRLARGKPTAVELRY